MIRLECTLGKHNKFFELDLIRNNGHVFFKALYGRTGQAGQKTIIYHGDNFEEAQEVMKKKQMEQLPIKNEGGIAAALVLTKDSPSSLRKDSGIMAS